MVAQSTREVLIVAKVVPDQGNAATFKQLAESVKTVQKMQADTAKSIAASANTAAKEAERAEEQKWKKIEALDKRQFAARMKTIKDREQEEVRAAKAAEQAADKAYRAIEAADKRTFAARMKTIKEREQAEAQASKAQQQSYTKAMAQADQMTAKAQASNMAIAEGFKQGIGGATALARGFALLGISSEDDLQKAIQSLAKVEAGVQAVRGVVDLVQGWGKMWRAYAAAVEAAAAAHAALATAKTIADAAGGVKGTAKGVASGVAGAAGNAVGGTIVSRLLGRVAGAGASVAGGGVGAGTAAAGSGLAAGALTGGAILAMVAGLAAATKSAWEVVKDANKYGLGGGAAPGSWNDKVAGVAVGVNKFVKRYTGIGPDFYNDLNESDDKTERLEKQRQKLVSQKDVAEQYWSQKIGLENRAQIAPTTSSEADRLLAESRARYQAATSQPGTFNSVVQGRGDQYLTALERAVALRKEEAEQQRQITREQIQGAQQRIADLEQEQQKRLEMAKLIREETQTAKERFGALTTQDQSRLINIKRRMDMGGELSREEESELEQYGDKDTAAEIKRRRSKRADEAGFGGFYNERKAEAAAQQEETIAGKIEATIKDERGFVINLERNEEALAKRMAEQTKSLLNERDAVLKEMFQRELEALDNKYAQEGHTLGALNRGFTATGQ